MKKKNNWIKKHPVLSGFFGLVLLVIAWSVLNPSSAHFPENFTIVTLPDTQFYSESYPEIFTEQTNWIVRNTERLNIKMVLHLGDIVNDFKDIEQWERASASMSILDDEVPYMVLPGNHDFLESLPDLDDINILNNSYDNYNKYFGTWRFEDYEYYQESIPDNENQNSYALLDIEGIKLGFLSLSYYPQKDHYEWGNKVLSDNRDVDFIVSVHDYLDPTVGIFESDGPSIGQSFWHGVIKHNDRSSLGEYFFWNRMIRNNENVFLVVSAHNYDVPEHHNTAIGDKKNRVHQVLSNYQALENGGNGWLRYYTFVPSKDKIKAYSYSPYLDEYGTEFELKYDMSQTKL